MPVTGLIVGIAILLLIKAIGALAGGTFASAMAFDRLVANGVPARGILLEVSSISTTLPGSQRQLPTSAGSQPVAVRRFESRFVTMDVEIPGQAPYIVQMSPMIPANMSRDILPGATVELRLDPKRPNLIAIVGPGAAFAVAQLNAAPVT